MEIDREIFSMVILSLTALLSFEQLGPAGVQSELTITRLKGQCQLKLYWSVMHFIYLTIHLLAALLHK